MTEDVDEYQPIIEANIRRLRKLARGYPKPFLNMSLGAPKQKTVTYSGFMLPPNLIYFLDIDEPNAKIFSYTSNTPFGEILEELAER